MKDIIENQQFDFNDAVQQLLSGKNINGKDGVLAPLVKQLVIIPQYIQTTIYKI